MYKFLKENFVVFILLLFCISIGILEPRFFTVTNLLNILKQGSVNALIAGGMTLVIISGGIDLSVGSILAVSGSIGALILFKGFGVAPMLLGMLIVAILLGLSNGVLISYFKLQPFIVTLIVMTFARGVVYLITEGRPITLNSEVNGYAFLDMIGTGSVVGVSVPVLLVIIVYGVFFILMHKTKFGRYVYAVGGNEKAAYLSGINIVKVKVWVYVFSGICSSLAALVLVSRLASAQPTAGMGYELDAIAATVLGGTFLTGGKGLVLKTLLGACIIAVLSNSLNILNISSYWQMIIKSLVILLTVLISSEKFSMSK